MEGRLQMALKVLVLLVLVAVSSAERPQSRWSRQISSYTSDISDWVPLSGPIEREVPQIRRQAVAEPRILSEPFPGFVKPTGFSQDAFPSRGFYNSPSNRQLYLQSVPSAPQNYITEQGFNQGLRFGLAQPNFPLSQGFVAPQYSFDNIPQTKPRPQIHSNHFKFENAPPNPSPPIQNPVKPFVSQAVKNNHETPKFIDGYRAENNSSLIYAKKPQSLQKIKFELADKSKEVFGAPKPKVEREEVQLLYMPLESLNRGQFNFRSPLTSAQLVNTELYNQRQNPLIQNLAAELQSAIAQPMDAFNSQEFLTNYNGRFREVDHSPRFSTTTTPFSPTAPTTTAKPKKLKPHQPPLAIFSTHDAENNDQVKVGDVLQSLKNANTVAVLDSVNPLNAPKVFIGPSSLSPPENYVKFELPYLSNIENIDKKLRQLPFFVAPLSYNTPQGFAKIPFPSPHVGSVVINSLIRDSSSAIKPSVADTYSNLYSRPQYRQEQKPVTQKPVISYYTTSSPKVNSPNYEQNYYSIEPQAVSTLRPLKETESNVPITQSTPPPYKTSSYFLSNLGNQYNPSQFVNFPQETNYKISEPAKTQNVFKPETTTTPRTTVTTSSKPSTYPSQLLETHNPYSINQAFHFSTPLDYQNFFDEYKEAYGNSGPKLTISPPSISISSTLPPAKQEVEPEQPKVEHKPQQVSPNYQQNYIPEIHHESEIPNSRYSVFNTNDYFTKTAQNSQNDNTNSGNPANSDGGIKTITNTYQSPQYTDTQTQSNTSENHTAENVPPETSADDNQVIKSSSEYDQYDAAYNSQEILSSTSSTTTSTRRPPIRTRGRPRYPTAKPDSGEYSTRATITRRPLRERKPLPSRSRFEPNQITTESSTRKIVDSSERTTTPTRTRTRGRVHYKVPDYDENYTKRNKPSKKENDLAYQRDVLHQNYPVTLMERTSTVDIEAITEPNVLSSNDQKAAKAEDTEDAYSNDKVSITAPVNSELDDLPQQYTNAIHSVTEAPYAPKVPNQEEDYVYQQKSSVAPQDTAQSYDEVKEERYVLKASPQHNLDNQDNVFFATQASSPEAGTNIPVYSNNDEYQSKGEEEITSTPELGTEVGNQELSQGQEENIVETTPSYNRVRVRPGVIRQYHQTSSGESLRTDRRKPVQPITYRPAFDKRRTTMRIEEIQADLKTKQVHVRPGFQDYKQPVYKPEPSTESSAPTSTTEITTKRGQFRRRRPSYATTEPTITRRPYEAKNRFRGRRPTEKPTDKPEVQTDISSTTVKNNLHSRYSHRPRLSERYNKKPETEDQVSEDQDSNYSINRPKYAAPETDRWSPKISTDSFKPYNPNDIADEAKVSSASDSKSKDELDIITAKNEYEDILISVTPAYNNRVNKKLPDIPPTLEALVEQSKVTKSDSTDTMSTFESMLEEVMKSLEEQDENEYTSNVMKHKGGEIGEIPPERIISSGENYSLKSTTPIQEEATTPVPDNATSTTATEEVPIQKNRRRGFWKKVKVRPVTEVIDAAESQYYPHVVNRVGQYVSKNSLEKSGKGNPKFAVTTYKPNYQFLKDFFETHEDALDAITNIDIPKITTASNIESNTEIQKEIVSTTRTELATTTDKINPGELDLGTGSPDPTYDDTAYYSEPTEPTTRDVSVVDRSDGFSLMDYLFGVTAPEEPDIKNVTTSEKEIRTTTELPKDTVQVDTEAPKIKITTESSYVPEEMTAETVNDNNESVTETLVELQNNDKRNRVSDESVVQVESSSISSFMEPANVVSTSMSTEVSHETEICFRGKCIKTNKNLL
ncbi:uncharacterized protein LOC123865373 isoform X1 [Maniola jurtina]|uniref:uncharacterized protein LOC123865373 isoform X1 n=2 Tax=Maniola jurtina TaxID=191418 RepID=UPI001E68F6B3|nr:uncharacterized protein LOC123865373 isoform X1 [Maniola jurtina]